MDAFVRNILSCLEPWACYHLNQGTWELAYAALSRTCNLCFSFMWFLIDPVLPPLILNIRSHFLHLAVPPSICSRKYSQIGLELSFCLKTSSSADGVHTLLRPAKFSTLVLPSTSSKLPSYFCNLDKREPLPLGVRTNLHWLAFSRDFSFKRNPHWRWWTSLVD